LEENSREAEITEHIKKMNNISARNSSPVEK
jgi:hypothetical protein